MGNLLFPWSTPSFFPTLSALRIIGLQSGKTCDVTPTIPEGGQKVGGHCPFQRRDKDVDLSGLLWYIARIRTIAQLR